MSRTSNLLLRNASILDLDVGSLSARTDVAINGGRITEIGPHLRSPASIEIDLAGRVLMPGLIDCHLHICADSMTAYPNFLPSVAVARAARILKDTLLRGFTTVRDAGGADAGYRQAVAEELIVGPRLFVAGRAISQTGGHGDLRFPGDLEKRSTAMSELTGMRIVDGVDEMRRAAREELRRGADQVKLLVSGGISSPSDPLMGDQFSDAEIACAVEEARRAGKYTMAHAYSPASIARAVKLGVRTVEHGNFLDEAAAQDMARAGAFLVPTLVVYKRAVEHAAEIGISAFHLEKAREVLAVGPRSLEIAARAGVKIGFGTDLFRAPKEYQCEEFLIREAVQKPLDILRSATLVGAEIVGLEGQVGRVAKGYLADLIALDGNPLQDLGLFQGQGRSIPLILKAGKVMKCAPELDPPDAPGRSATAWERL